MNRMVFQPFYNTMNNLVFHYKKPLIEVKAHARKWVHIVATTLNGIKKAFIGVIILVSGAALTFFSLITWPYRKAKMKKIGLDDDLDLLSYGEAKAIKLKISNFIFHNSKKLNLNISDREQVITKVMAYYARSRKYYAPVLLEWVHYLLSKANDPDQTKKINEFHKVDQVPKASTIGSNENPLKTKKIVFMARDGIPAYKIAIDLLNTRKGQKQYPNLLKPHQVTLGYFSRKVINSCYLAGDAGFELFRKYVNKELNIKDGENLIFVDIGFEGSMIDKIRTMLPKNNIEFEYLVSVNNDKATGFLANKDVPLPAVPSAGANFGVHWWEDTHQGCNLSPEKLVEGQDGRIYPNTMIPGQEKTCLEKNPTEESTLEYLIKTFCDKGGVEPKDLENEPSIPKAGETNRNKPRLTKEFNSILEKIKQGKRLVFIKHK